MNTLEIMKLDIIGLGLILFSPKHAEMIEPGSDYLSSSYMSEDDVQAHIQKGTIVGFSTGTPGRFSLDFFTGYPSDEILKESDYKLRLGLHCVGGVVCVRDLYDLMDWDPECPKEQMIKLADGYYHVTLCSNIPSSGLLGDDQKIDVYLQLLDEFPDLAKHGIPTLCC